MVRKNESWRKSAILERHDPHDDGSYIKGRVFVGMAFDLPSDLSDVFQVIKSECEALDLVARRVDAIPGSAPIPNTILREIEEAEFLIFDLSDERPSVYYELGYAHGAGNRANEILLIAEAGSKIHFDAAQLSIVFYKSATDLRNKLPQELSTMISLARRED